MYYKLLLSTLLLFIFNRATAQKYYQYFDGANTNPSQSVIIDIAPGNNTWQVGRPQKIVFDSAATLPNVIVTDTLNFYPSNDSSVFTFKIEPRMNWGVLALRWKQKLDMDTNHAGGVIEFSANGGASWENVFNNPVVYNFYGFDTANYDTLNNGDFAFSGVDSNWKDIWLCYDNSFLSMKDSILLRYTFKSDTLSNPQREGWMIDNMMVQITFAHTVAKGPSNGQYLNVYPTHTTGIVNIEAEKRQQFHIIEDMQVVDAAGRVVKRYKDIPTKYFIDISDQPDGVYYLKVKTNVKSETFTVLLKR